MADSFNNPDFYVATATVIPVLWLSAGLASSAVGYLAEKLEPGPEAMAALFPFGLHPGTSASRTKVFVTLFGFFGFYRRAFVYLFVLSGAVGELLAIIVLFLQEAPVAIGPIVLAAVCIVIVQSAVILALAMALASKVVRDTKSTSETTAGKPETSGTPS